MADQLSIYREALAFLREARIATVSDDIASRYAIDDAYARAQDYLLRAAPWRFALKTATLSTGGTPISGYSISSVKPTDWLRTHAIFVLSGTREIPIDCKDQDTHIYSNTTPIMRYVRSGLTVTDYPEQFCKALSAYLAFLLAGRITGSAADTNVMAQIWQGQFAAALATDAIPENPWLIYQLDGSFYAHSRNLINMGFWRFAMKTVKPGTANSTVPGFKIAATKPADWARTFTYGVLSGDIIEPIDFHDEGGKIHSAYAGVLRYVSTDGYNPTTWSDNFMNAVLACLQYEAAKSDPKATGAGLQARALAYQKAFSEARKNDDISERPKVFSSGRITEARRNGPSSFASEQGL